MAKQKGVGTEKVTLSVIVPLEHPEKTKTQDGPEPLPLIDGLSQAKIQIKTSGKHIKNVPI